MDRERGGELFVVSTPIGNLEDITFRAVRILNACDIIAAEDTRVTRILLAHHGIRTPTVSYHAHNALEKAPLLVSRMRDGQKVALVSDAGTPLVSDPGEVLVRLAADSGIPVRPVPGASALLAGLVVVEWAAVRCLRQYPAKAKVTEAPSVTDQRWVSVYLFDTALAEHRLRPLAPIQRPVIERWDTLPGRRPRCMPNASAHARDDRGLVTAGVVASRSAGRLAGLAHAKRATNLQRTKGRSIEYGPLWRRELTSPGD